jgi:hypothetical protein
LIRLLLIDLLVLLLVLLILGLFVRGSTPAFQLENVTEFKDGIICIGNFSIRRFAHTDKAEVAQLTPERGKTFMVEVNR